MVASQRNARFGEKDSFDENDDIRKNKDEHKQQHELEYTVIANGKIPNIKKFNEQHKH
ncbi:hypothetical protein [Paenibacillus sp. QZ-Y1]|uniref:hypothetical protein n=1 Tax=Paenibacillus sp. QZ-Y1 TaxID=3414511 RepID=UPI003F79D12D